MPLALLVIALGVKPALFTRPLEPAVAGLLSEMNERTARLNAHELSRAMAGDPGTGVRCGKAGR